jgi:tRNA pseudouridine38-40 synthase
LPHFKLTLSYDGTPFVGWQRQAAGVSIQGLLEDALAVLDGQPVPVAGAGRTDAGVHALGQCAHADVSATMKSAEWQRALNANLPPTIRVMKSSHAAPSFHARFSAKGKVYRYLIRNGPVLPPQEFGRVWHVPQTLELGIFRQALTHLVGEHDFRAFSAQRGKLPGDTRRTIQKVSLAHRGDLLTLTFQGDGFLYKMVRMLTAALVRVAQRRDSLESLQSRLKTGTPRSNHVAPPDGLTLMRVLY